MIYEVTMVDKSKAIVNDEALLKQCQRVVDEFNRLKFKNNNDPAEEEFTKWEYKKMFDRDSFFYNDETKELVNAEEYFRNKIYPSLRFDDKASAKQRSDAYEAYADEIMKLLANEVDKKSAAYIRQIYDYGFLDPFYDGKSPEEGFQYLMSDGRIRNLIEELKENYGQEEE